MKAEQQSFEESWQQAFEQASLNPPNHVWENIERELDQKRHRPFLLLWVRPQVLAGGIAAALLILWAGIGFFQENVKSNKIVLDDKTKAKQNTTKQATKIENDDLKNMLSSANIAPPIIKNKTVQVVAKESNKLTSTKAINAKENLEYLTETLSLNNNEGNTKLIDNQLVTKNSTIEIFSKNTNKGAILANFESLKTRGFYVYGTRFTMDRNKLAFDANEQEMPEKSTPNGSKFYVGLQSGAAPFSPNIQLQTVSTNAFSMAQNYAKTASSSTTTGNSILQINGTTTVNIAAPQNEIKSGFSTNYGLNFGYKISKNWGIESGLRYLQGNSTLSSNSYSIDATTGLRSNYLAQYLASKAVISGVAYALNPSMPINAVIADIKRFDNRYEYLTIPLQASYTLLPMKHLNFSVLGGFAADIFLKNTIIDNINLSQKTTFTAGNNIYKPMNISGLAGIRGNYQFDKHWQTTLGASYQQALSSGLESSTDLQMKLQLWGLQAGMNYHF